MKDFVQSQHVLTVVSRERACLFFNFFLPKTQMHQKKLVVREEARKGSAVQGKVIYFFFIRQILPRCSFDLQTTCRDMYMYIYTLYSVYMHTYIFLNVSVRSTYIYIYVICLYLCVLRIGQRQTERFVVLLRYVQQSPSSIVSSGYFREQVKFPPKK